MTGDETPRTKPIVSTTVDVEGFPSENGQTPEAQPPALSEPRVQWLINESSEQIDSEGLFPSEDGCSRLIRIVVAEPSARTMGPDTALAGHSEPDWSIDVGRNSPAVEVLIPVDSTPTETFDLPFVYGSGEEAVAQCPSALTRTIRSLFFGVSRISSRIGAYARTRVHAARTPVHAARTRVHAARAVLSSVHRKSAHAVRHGAFAVIRVVNRAVAAGKDRAPLIIRAIQRLASATLGIAGRTIRAALWTSHRTMILVGRYGVVTSLATIGVLNRFASQYRLAGNMEARVAAIRTIVRGRLAVLACGVVLGAAGVLLLQQVPGGMTVATPPVAREQSSGAVLQVRTEPSVLPSQVGRNGGGAALTDRNVAAQVPAAAPRSRSGPRFRGALTVRSSPAGARVFLNGVLAGTTPLLLNNLAVGSRAMRLERDGYVRWSSTVRIVANERTSVAATLRPASSGD